MCKFFYWISVGVVTSYTFLFLCSVWQERNSFRFGKICWQGCASQAYWWKTRCVMQCLSFITHKNAHPLKHTFPCQNNLFLSICQLWLVLPLCHALLLLLVELCCWYLIRHHIVNLDSGLWVAQIAIFFFSAD